MAPPAAKSTLILIYLVFIATIGPFQYGYHLGELNAPQKVITCELDENPTFYTTGVPQCIPMTDFQWGLVQAIFTIGGLLGALFAGSLATKYGRLLAMRSTTLFFVVGPLLQALAPNVATMCIGRFLSGIGAGASTVVCPIYIAEISPLEKRGLFGAFTQVMINVGILIAQVLGYFLSRGSLWRIILAIAGITGALELLGLFFAPESPKWLADHRHTTQAKRILQRIRGRDANIEAEIKEWHVGLESDEEPLLASPTQASPMELPAQDKSQVSFLDVVRLPKDRPAVIGVMAVMVTQQLTGINSIVMYSVAILGAILPSSAALLTVMVALLNVIVTTLCAPLADKIGRKPALLLSIGSMGVSSVLLAIGLSSDIKALSATATLLFVAGFGVGLGPVPFILASELVGPDAVGATQSWALGINWLSTFIVAQFFPVINAALSKGRVYWIFAAVALVMGLFIAWWVPETKGKANADEVWGREPERED